MPSGPAPPCLAGNRIGRVDVSEPASISTAIAARYALAMFELARDEGSLAAVEDDLAALEAALQASAEFATMINSPLLSRDAQGAAMAALAGKMGLSPVTANTLGLMAGKRRLYVLPQLIAEMRALIAEEKGEVTAEVTAAKALTKAQQKTLAETLKKAIGKTVRLDVAVDEALIGGMIVKVGSKMIDSSIASRLANLQNAMKEVG